MDTDLDVAEASAAHVTDTHLVVVLKDGREIATPLDWYPALLSAPPDVRRKFEVSPFGIHWPDLDEDFSVDGMVKGRRGVGR